MVRLLFLLFKLLLIFGSISFLTKRSENTIQLRFKPLNKAIQYKQCDFLHPTRPTAIINQ